MSLLDAVLPAPDHATRRAVTVRAPAKVVFAAVESVSAGDLPVMRILMGVRMLPALLRRPAVPRPRPTSLIEDMCANGFAILARDEGTELVIGAVGQFWKPSGGRTFTITDAAAFSSFDEPGYARAAMTLRCEPVTPGTTRLYTETRVDTTDAAARRAFGRYWFLVRAGSQLIRVEMLRAIRRRAERRGEGVPPGEAGNGSPVTGPLPSRPHRCASG